MAESSMRDDWRGVNSDLEMIKYSEQAKFAYFPEKGRFGIGFWLKQFGDPESGQRLGQKSFLRWMDTYSVPYVRFGGRNGGIMIDAVDLWSAAPYWHDIKDDDDPGED